MLFTCLLVEGKKLLHRRSCCAKGAGLAVVAILLAHVFCKMIFCGKVTSRDVAQYAFQQSKPGGNRWKWFLGLFDPHMELVDKMVAEICWMASVKTIWVDISKSVSVHI